MRATSLEARIFHPVTPARILDTRRPGFGAIGPDTTLDLKVTGAGGVPPAGATAVALNVTVAGATAPSFLTVFPAGEAKPNASNVNFVAGQIVANLVVAKLGARRAAHDLQPGRVHPCDRRRGGLVRTLS